MKINISADFVGELEKFVLKFKNASSILAGENKGLRKGGKFEFAGHKPYIQGDDYRDIDWNAGARFDTLSMKTFFAESTFRTHVVVDTSQSMTGKLEYAFKLAAAICFIGLHSNSQVSISINEDKNKLKLFGSYKGKPEFFKLLDELTNYDFTPEKIFDLNAKKLQNQMPRKSLVIVISDGYDEKLKEEISLLRSMRFEVMLLQPFTPEEISPKFYESMNLTDAETSEKLKVTTSKNLMSEYTKMLEQFIADWKFFCSKSNISHAWTEITQPIPEFLYHFFT